MPVVEVIFMGMLLTKTVYVVGKAQQELQNMYATESGFTAVYEVIDDASREREVASGKFAHTFYRQLRIRDVSFEFGANQILSHSKFNLNSRQKVAHHRPYAHSPHNLAAPN